VRPSLLLAFLGLLFAGCDKKASPCPPDKQPTVVKSTFEDVPPPPPVVIVPDTPLWRQEDTPLVRSVEDAGPVPHTEKSDVAAVVHAQAAFVEAKSKKLDELEEEVKEAKRLIKAKMGRRKDFDAWRKKHGAKIPTMKPLEQLERQNPKWKVEQTRSKRAVYPRFITPAEGDE